jgi:hypothetical protein
MKNIKLALSLSLALAFVVVSCDDDDFVQYQGEAFQSISDPFLQIKTPVIAFQAGIPSYTMEFNLVNGLKRVNAVEVYTIFTDASTGASSNEALLGTYTAGAGDFTSFSDDLTYDDLKAGLTVNGGPLPADEVDIAIGSGWIFRFVGKTDSGDIPLAGSIRVGVLSRFAGLYEVVASEYYRIGVLTATWDGQSRFIGSVDETTFSYNDWWGNFAWAGNSFHFRLNEADNTLTVPILVNGALFSGNRALDCAVEPQTFTSVSCAGSNVLEPDDAGGHHVIKLTYGYFTDGSGSREFQETLRKL